MHGWKARIGAIVLSDDTTVEPEFTSAVPNGVSVHAARMFSTPGVSTISELEGLRDEVSRCADLLKTAEVDVVSYNCTTGSLINGPGYEQELEEEIEEEIEIPAVTTAGAIKRAFDALDVESVAITTPYLEEINEREAKYLRDSGYGVADISGYQRGARPERYTAPPPERAYREARAVDSPDADAVFISCTGYRTFEIIPALEADIGKPVVTSNQATLWNVLRTADVDYRDVGLGMIFEK